MKSILLKLSAWILSVGLLASMCLFCVTASAATYTGVNGGQAQGGLDFASDWGQKAVSKKPVKLDGLSVTFTNAVMTDPYTQLALGLTKSADGIDHNSTGDGVMFKLMYSGTNAVLGQNKADVMPMNLKDWHDTNAPSGTAWVDDYYLGDGIWSSYTLSIKKNGGNYIFQINEKVVATVPAADVEALTGTTPYVTFYMWNNGHGKVTVSDVNGAMPKAEEYTLVGAAMTNRNITIVADWTQRVKYNEKVELDGLAITIRDLSIESPWGMIGFGFAKDKAGVEMDGSTGNGVLFKLAYSGNNTVMGQNLADVVPMNIENWNNTKVPDNTAWVHEKYLGDDLWDSYVFTIDKNGKNYDFKINDLLVASVPVAQVQELTNADGSAWLSLYAWNGKNTYAVESIRNTKSTVTTTAAPVTQTTRPADTTAPAGTTATASPTAGESTTATETVAGTDTTATVEGSAVTTLAQTTLPQTASSQTTLPTAAGDNNAADTDTAAKDHPGWILPVVILAAVLLAVCVVGGIILYKRLHTKA